MSKCGPVFTCVRYLVLFRVLQRCLWYKPKMKGRFRVVATLKCRTVNAVTGSAAAHAQWGVTAAPPIQTARQAQTHTDAREAATASIRPRPSLASTNLGPGRGTPIAITPPPAFFFFLNFYLFIFSFVWLPLGFLAVFVPLSRHPRRSRLPVGAADLDDAAGGRADSGRG